MSYVPGSLVKRCWSEIECQRASAIGWDTEQLLREVGLVISVRTLDRVDHRLEVIVLCTVLWPDGSCNDFDADSLKTIEQEA